MKSVDRSGLVKISFSKALRVPRAQDKTPNFKDLPSDVIFAVYNKQSVNDYEITFQYKLLEFDPNGLWLTIQLEFDQPLFVSLGEYADQVVVYLNKEFFLHSWVFVKEKESTISKYNNNRRLSGYGKMPAQFYPNDYI